MDGRRLIAIAKTYLACHYLNGSYGAYPTATGENGRGAPNRPGGVSLILDPKRLDPAVDIEETGFAVKAATMFTKGTHCVCAGSYASIPGGRRASPTDPDLKDYLAKLGPDPQTWPNFFEIYTPRRAYGQGQKGALVWGEDCTEIRHFDCITYVNYCIWQLTGAECTYAIWQWKDEAAGAGKARWVSRVTGATVYRLSSGSTPALQDGDIVAGTPQNAEHIGLVGSDGTVYQAQDTTMGVHAKSRFSPGSWQFLIRRP